jgi:hypothetical protein
VNLDQAPAKVEVAPLGRFVPKPKRRLRDQFHEVARFRHLREKFQIPGQG